MSTLPSARPAQSFAPLADDDTPALHISSYGNDSSERDGVGGAFLLSVSSLVGRADYLESAAQDADFWVDAAIEEPWAEPETKVRDLLSACLSVTGGEVRGDRQGGHITPCHSRKLRRDTEEGDDLHGGDWPRLGRHVFGKRECRCCLGWSVAYPWKDGRQVHAWQP